MGPSIVISRLSTHPGYVHFFFLTKIRVRILLFEHVMQSHLPRMHEFFKLDIQCQFVNVSLKRSSPFIVHLSNFRLNIGAKQLVINVEDSAM